MKKLFSIAILSIAILFVSCSEDATTNPVAEKKIMKSVEHPNSLLPLSDINQWSYEETIGDKEYKYTLTLEYEKFRQWISPSKYDETYKINSTDSNSNGLLSPNIFKNNRFRHFKDSVFIGQLESNGIATVLKIWDNKNYEYTGTQGKWEYAGIKTNHYVGGNSYDTVYCISYKYPNTSTVVEYQFVKGIGLVYWFDLNYKTMLCENRGYLISSSIK